VQPLQERGVDGAVGEAPFRAGLVVDRREDVGLGPGVADRGEHALGSPEVEQEVVDERDAGGHRTRESRNSGAGGLASS
jgi:hypothetical protein